MAPEEQNLNKLTTLRRIRRNTGKVPAGRDSRADDQGLARQKTCYGPNRCIADLLPNSPGFMPHANFEGCDRPVIQIPTGLQADNWVHFRILRKTRPCLFGMSRAARFA